MNIFDFDLICLFIWCIYIFVKHIVVLIFCEDSILLKLHLYICVIIQLLEFILFPLSLINIAFYTLFNYILIFSIVLDIISVIFYNLYEKTYNIMIIYYGTLLILSLIAFVLAIIMFKFNLNIFLPSLSWIVIGIILFISYPFLKSLFTESNNNIYKIVKILPKIHYLTMKSKIILPSEQKENKNLSNQEKCRLNHDFSKQCINNLLDNLKPDILYFTETHEKVLNILKNNKSIHIEKNKPLKNIFFSRYKIKKSYQKIYKKLCKTCNYNNNCIYNPNNFNKNDFNGYLIYFSKL